MLVSSPWSLHFFGFLLFSGPPFWRHTTLQRTIKAKNKLIYVHPLVTPSFFNNGHGPPTIAFVTRNREGVNEHTTSTWPDDTHALFLVRLRRKRALSRVCGAHLVQLRVSFNPIYAPGHVDR